MLHNAIEVVVGATGVIDPWQVQSFITGAALNLAETGQPQWQAKPHYQTLEAAYRNADTPIRRHDFELARQYWLEELPAMADRTRSSINAGVMGYLFAFNTGVVRNLVATTTTISPEDLEKGIWWLVNLPITPGDATSTVVNASIKYVTQRHILRRKARPRDPLLVVWSDEFQKVANSYDAAFLAECRSHKGCMVVLTQSIHAMYANLYGTGGEHQTDSLLTNFGHVVVHTLGDAKSAEYASSLLGRRRELFITPSTSHTQEMWDVIMGHPQSSVSASESYQPVLQPTVFLSGLRTGGPPHNIVDGIVLRTGQPFSTGEQYLMVPFRQK